MYIYVYTHIYIYIYICIHLCIYIFDTHIYYRVAKEASRPFLACLFSQMSHAWNERNTNINNFIDIYVCNLGFSEISVCYRTDTSDFICANSRTLFKDRWRTIILHMQIWKHNIHISIYVHTQAKHKNEYRNVHIDLNFECHRQMPQGLLLHPKSSTLNPEHFCKTKIYMLRQTYMRPLEPQPTTHGSHIWAPQTLDSKP